jgi:hypothetical protein
MDGVAGTDLVRQAIAELYSGDLDAFIQRRRDLAAEARSAGDRAAAKTIASLGKPTRSAWAVNRLVHADPTVPGRLAELGDRLRAGEATLDGASIRELSRARRELIDALTRRALAEAGQQPPSAAMREEVTDTFSAALADPQVAEQVAAGTLLRAAHWAGFGPGIGAAIGTAPAAVAVPGGRAGGGKTRTAGQAAAAQAKPRKAVAEGDEAAQRAVRDRERLELVAEAEKMTAEASRVADAAAASEREIAESVRFMQERLSSEQQRLVQARRDARQAAAALARAQQMLERRRRQLPR